MTHRTTQRTANLAAALVIVSGTAAIASETPVLSNRDAMQSQHVGHIYFNIMTGERIVTLIDDAVRPADTGASVDLWIADNGLPCADFGQTIGSSGVLDSPNCTTCLPSTATGAIFLDWGDIAPDTVIDCVGISWSTQHLDTDTDSDGIGDGVPGFGATWAWFDGDNGFNSCVTRVGLTGFTLANLPGFVGTFDPGLLAVYTATVDLVGTTGSSIAFEVGDTDSIDSSGTGIYNPGAGDDLDGDELADFSYALQYIQPGTFDFDGDGMLDGDPAAAAIAGWSLGLPPGTTTDNGDGTFTYTPDPAPAGQGVEDAFDLFVDTDSDGVLEPIGTFWFGGFTCDANGDGITGDTRPFAQFAMSMFGPGDDICDADLAPPIGVLNFFDVNAYITAYNAGDLGVADLAAPFGSLNFFDVNAFITSYNAGCP